MEALGDKGATYTYVHEDTGGEEIKVNLIGRKTASHIAADLECTGLALHFGGENLSNAMVSLNEESSLHNLSILELGCGLGLVSIVLAKVLDRKGRQATIIATDGDHEALAFVEENVKTNCREFIEKWPRGIKTQLLFFGTEAHEASAIALNEGKLFDMILAADVLYEGEGWQVDVLFATVSRMLCKPHGSFFLAYTKRLLSIDLIFEAAGKYGLTWKLLPGCIYDIFANDTDEMTDLWANCVWKFSWKSDDDSAK